MTAKKPTAPTRKPPAAAPAAPIASAPAAAPNPASPTAAAPNSASAPAAAPNPASPTAAAQRSALDALQAELQEQRLRHLSERTQLERKVTSLELTLEELRAELAQATAHSRELQAQLLRLRGNR